MSAFDPQGRWLEHWKKFSAQKQPQMWSSELSNIISGQNMYTFYSTDGQSIVSVRPSTSVMQFLHLCQTLNIDSEHGHFWINGWLSIYRFGGQAFPHFERMINGNSTICDHSGHESASFDNCGDDSIAPDSPKICCCSFIREECAFAEKAQIQIWIFNAGRQAISLPDWSNLKHFDLL